MTDWLIDWLILLRLQLQAYEVCIGASDNSRTVIRYGVEGEEKAGADTAGVISPDTMRSFWIGWMQGNIYYTNS